MTQIVSAAFIKVENDKLKVLLTQRGAETTYPLHWCTPGGKVNKGARLETHQEALARELREELGLKYCPGINEFSRRAAEFLEHGKPVNFHEKEIEAMLHVAGILRGYLIELKRAKQVHP